MPRILILGFSAFIFFVTESYAQQRAQHTQYLMNNYLLNPAAGGLSNITDLKAGFRTQWTGIESSPKTFYLSGHGPIGYPEKRIRNSHKQPHHGLGGYAFHDQTGPIRMTGVSMSYTYHLKVSSNFTASMGAFLGLMQHRIKGDELIFVQNPDDPYVGIGDISNIVPDASVGLWLYSEQAYFGVSANQLFQSKIKLENPLYASEGKLNNHYYFTGGLKFMLNRDLFLIPSVLVKYVYSAPVQVDLNTKLLYNNMFWGGVSYRHLDALALFAGVAIDKNFEVGYSYDFTLSPLRKGSGGSHEIIVGIYLPFNRSRILCPAHFW